MWAPYLKTAEREEDIVAYVDKGREENHFTDFFFISRNGGYLSIDGHQSNREVLVNILGNAVKFTEDGT